MSYMFATLYSSGLALCIPLLIHMTFCDFSHVRTSIPGHLFMSPSEYVLFSTLLTLAVTTANGHALVSLLIDDWHKEPCSLSTNPTIHQSYRVPDTIYRYKPEPTLIFVSVCVGTCEAASLAAEHY
jgi:hypothetical protein